MPTLKGGVRTFTITRFSLLEQNLEEMDSDDWGSDSDSDSDSDDSEDEADMPKGRAKWLKRTDDTADKKKKKEIKRANKTEEGKKGVKDRVRWIPCPVVRRGRSDHKSSLDIDAPHRGFDPDASPGDTLARIWRGHESSEGHPCGMRLVTSIEFVYPEAKRGIITYRFKAHHAEAA